MEPIKIPLKSYLKWRKIASNRFYAKGRWINSALMGCGFSYDFDKKLWQTNNKISIHPKPEDFHYELCGKAVYFAIPDLTDNFTKKLFDKFVSNAQKNGGWIEIKIEEKEGGGGGGGRAGTRREAGLIALEDELKNMDARQVEANIFGCALPKRPTKNAKKLFAMLENIAKQFSNMEGETPVPLIDKKALVYELVTKRFDLGRANQKKRVLPKYVPVLLDFSGSCSSVREETLGTMAEMFKTPPFLPLPCSNGIISEFLLVKELYKRQKRAFPKVDLPELLGWRHQEANESEMARFYMSLQPDFVVVFGDDDGESIYKNLCEAGVKVLQFDSFGRKKGVRVGKPFHANHLKIDGVGETIEAIEGLQMAIASKQFMKWKA